MLERREFGKTGLKVFPLGFGAGHIGGKDQSEKEIDGAEYNDGKLNIHFA